jgi:hypothetical protein
MLRIRWWVSEVYRLWREYFRKDIEYYYVRYRTRDARGEDNEDGVISATTYREAARKAEIGKKLLEEPGFEESCRFESLAPISFREYRLLKVQVIDVDSFFDRHGKLIP